MFWSLGGDILEVGIRESRKLVVSDRDACVFWVILEILGLIYSDISF